MIITIIILLFNYDEYNHLYINNMPILMGIDIIHSNAIARHPRVRVSDGGAGNWPSARATPITTTTRHGHNARGVNAIPTTGANTAARIQITLSATARSNGSATTGGASA